LVIPSVPLEPLILQALNYCDYFRIPKKFPQLTATGSLEVPKICHFNLLYILLFFIALTDEDFAVTLPESEQECIGSNFFVLHPKPACLIKGIYNL